MALKLNLNILLLLALNREGRREEGSNFWGGCHRCCTPLSVLSSFDHEVLGWFLCSPISWQLCPPKTRWHLSEDQYQKYYGELLTLHPQYVIQKRHASSLGRKSQEFLLLPKVDTLMPLTYTFLLLLFFGMVLFDFAANTQGWCPLSNKSAP